MTKTQTGVLDSKVEALDFTVIKNKMLMATKGVRWTPAELDAAELEYKRFLTLHLLYPDVFIVPTTLIDEFWHHHILDTKKYRQDTTAVFGSFFDHYPYLGINGEQDAARHNELYQGTRDLYEKHFGGDYMGNSKAAKCGYCGGTPTRN